MATPASPPSQRNALLADSMPEIDALLDDVLCGENWKVHHVPDNQAVLAMALPIHSI